MLDQIDPHLTEIDEMPIVRVEIFSDLVVDAEFLSARPRAFENDGGTESQVFVHENARMLGDLNGDGRINVDDLLILLANWCEKADCCICCAVDLNADGKVDQDDLDILLDNWTGPGDPPE